MAGRPRTRSDDEILDAAARAIGDVGPGRLTLADVAREAGLVPATLVQRFGSKRALLVAVAARGASAAGEPFARARGTSPSPLAALEAALVAQAATLRDRRRAANHLAFLQLDLTDPELHGLAAAFAGTQREAIAGLLDEAVVAGELRRCDTAALARAVQVAYNGALITWAIDGEGEAAGRLREALAAVLGGVRA